MIDSDALHAFVMFAEELNFTRAAERLHISQPALHVKVNKLGDALGIALYRRRGRTLELTEHGRHVMAFGRELEEQSQAFLARLGKPVSERVVLAAGEGTLLYLLGDALRKMSLQSGVELRTLTRNREGTLNALFGGEAHLGVLPLDAQPDGLHVTFLRRVGFQVVMPRTHRLARRRQLKLTDLEGERLVLPAADRPHRQQVARALASRGVNFTLSVEASGWELMLHFAALGLGLAVVNDFCRIPRGTVARPLPELPSLRYCIAERSGRTLSQPARRLKELVTSAFAS